MSGSMNHLNLPAFRNLLGITIAEREKFIAIKAVSNVYISKRESPLESGKARFVNDVTNLEYEFVSILLTNFVRRVIKFPTNEAFTVVIWIE
jgi:hypothetical protein